uniref:uncharacterized protein LOC120340044 n=1 Tax=Styela clava TaxID=7725 RepID=UPI001939A392|nr:uncharacterized protein LOC120340044 [Styela clava]
MKFVLRAESPRDFVDILLSMKHQPNITIIDMANMIVAHGNNRKDGMFHPYNGMVVAPTEENISLAENGSLQVSLPWIIVDRSGIKEDSSDSHPATGSSIRMCLYDTFHQTNVTKRHEILRRVRNIKELHGTINTQVVEQLFSAKKYDSRFLNQMKANKHIFVFRSMIDRHNEAINASTMNQLTSEYTDQVHFDELGRVSIGKKVDQKHSKTHVSKVVDTMKTKRTEAEYERRWMNVLSLTDNDVRIIKSGAWLNDRLINAAMVLLRHPNINGLGDVITGPTYGFRRNSDVRDFIQILHVGENHWICISNVFSPEKEFVIYDSYQELSIIRSEGHRKQGDQKRIRYPLIVDQAACGLIKPKENRLAVKVADVTQQNRGDDCGLFAVAFATILSRGVNPVFRQINQETLRHDLEESYRNLSMEHMFCHCTVRKGTEIPTFAWFCDVYCSCRMPDDGTKMHSCAACGTSLRAPHRRT